MPTINKICENCGIEFSYYNCSSRHNSQNPRKFCTQKCYSENKKGKKFTPERVANMRHAKLRENVVKYGDYECEKCHKKFDTNTGLRSHRSYCSNETEVMNVSCPVCSKIFKRARSLVNHLMMHDPIKAEKHKQRVRDGVAKRAPMKRNSKGEILFLEILREVHGTDVIHKFRIPNIEHEYDYYIPSSHTIIEYDGDYWHGNPKTQTLNNRMRKQFRIDLAYTKAAIEQGYKVLRVWESEVSEYPNKFRELRIDKDDETSKDQEYYEETGNSGLRYTNTKQS